MTIAKLHDGRVLKFDNSVHPKAIQAAIKAHLEEENSEKRQKEEKERFEKEENLRKEKETKQQREKERGEDTKHHKDMLETLQLGVVGLQHLADKMPDISKISDKLEALAKSVKSLESTITKASETHKKVMLAPEIAERDAKGRLSGKRRDYKDEGIE